MGKHKSNVLIVEDEKGIKDVYQFVLKGAGYNVKSVLNGQEALKILETFEPDIILLDIRMPKIDGIEFLKQYDVKKHPNVKVVVLSNYDMESEIKQAHKLGAAHYVLKAWTSPKELELLVKKVLQEK
jgi:CheY-like chemotaxis protein